MKRRVLGNSGLEVSALGLGCMNMTGPYGPPQDAGEMITLLHQAVERGVTFFDTAEGYGPLRNERLLGEAFEGIRGDVVIATKFGIDIDVETGEMLGGLNSRPEHIRAAATTQLAETDWRSGVSRFSAGHRDANLVLVDLVRDVAARKDATPAQVALGWLLAQKPWIVPIPGTTKLYRLEENLGGVDVEFFADELAEISAAASNVQPAGERMPEAFLEQVGK